MYLCIFFNIWGFIVYFAQTRKKSIYPYDYSTIRQDALDAGLEVSKVEAMDKAAGYSK